MLTEQNVTFAGVNVPLRVNTLKQGLEILSWPFVENSNFLEISLLFGATEPIVRSAFDAPADGMVLLWLGKNRTDIFL